MSGIRPCIEVGLGWGYGANSGSISSFSYFSFGDGRISHTSAHPRSSFAFFSLAGNVLSIGVLYRRDMDLKAIFRQILITLVTFDLLCIVCNLLLFSLPQLSESYFNAVFPYIVPTVLPVAQIALTGKERDHAAMGTGFV